MMILEMVACMPWHATQHPQSTLGMVVRLESSLFIETIDQEYLRSLLFKRYHQID